MSTEDEPTMVDVVVTCATEGCGNAGIPIPLSVPDTVTAYACGVCGQPITDVKPASEATTEPAPEPATESEATP